MSTIRARFTALQHSGLMRVARLRASNTSQSAETCAAWWLVFECLRTAAPTTVIELDTIDAGTLVDDLGDLCLLLRGTPDSTAIASMRGAIRKIRMAIEAA